LTRVDYGLETLPIIIAGYLFLLSYPGRYISHRRGERHEIAARIEAELNAADGIFPASSNEEGSEKIGSAAGSVDEKRHWWSKKKSTA